MEGEGAPQSERKVSGMRSQMSSIQVEHLDVVIKRAKLQSCSLLIARGGGMIRAGKITPRKFPESGRVAFLGF